MIIGIPKEIKKAEYRVGLTSSGARELKKEGYTVLIERGAGQGSGFSDTDYLETDADIADRETLFKSSELIVKAKEPLSEEYNLFREGQKVFYLSASCSKQRTHKFSPSEKGNRSCL